MCAFDTGETIYSREDEAIYFYILVEGRLRVDRLYENGKEVLLKLYSPYNFIGDLEWAMNRFTIDNQVTAITKVTCAAIPMSAIEARQSFYEFIKQQDLSRKAFRECLTRQGVSEKRLVMPEALPMLLRGIWPLNFIPLFRTAPLMPPTRSPIVWRLFCVRF